VLAGGSAGVQDDILNGMGAFVEKQLPLLRPISDNWQPSDLLPDMSLPGWRDDIAALRKNAGSVPDALLVVLIGNLITEEALPSYQTWLNRVKGLGDETGASLTPWGRWTRGWTAEENRHGDILNRYLYLSGRVNMRSVEVTIQNLLNNGFDLNSGSDAYRSLVYASFQERATKVSHANAGRLAEKCGDPLLARMCSMIAGDEARHEEAYKRFFAYIIERDPSTAVIAFAEMMKRRIAMPARLMSDGSGRDVFEDYAVAAQRSGVYTTRDYADIIAHLVEYWQIAGLTGLTVEAREAQERLCGLSAHFVKKADKVDRLLSEFPPQPFSWIFDRTA
jgi:acyl-[acyl-carrier-protein] desaturase